MIHLELQLVNEVTRSAFKDLKFAFRAVDSKFAASKYSGGQYLSYAHIFEPAGVDDRDLRGLSHSIS